MWLRDGNGVISSRHAVCPARHLRTARRTAILADVHAARRHDDAQSTQCTVTYLLHYTGGQLACKQQASESRPSNVASSARANSATGLLVSRSLIHDAHARGLTRATQACSAIAVLGAGSQWATPTRRCSHLHTTCAPRCYQCRAVCYNMRPIALYVAR
jgi:hypothetical protein